MLGTGLAFGQEELLPNEEICHPLVDDQKLYQAYIENPLLKQEISLLKQKLQIADEKDKLKDERIALEEKRGDMYKEAAEAQKDLTDRALKLADSSKGTRWDLLGVFGAIAVIVVTIAAVL